jgi:hypothetical protein
MGRGGGWPHAYPQLSSPAPHVVLTSLRACPTPGQCLSQVDWSNIRWLAAVFDISVVNVCAVQACTHCRCSIDVRRLRACETIRWHSSRVRPMREGGVQDNGDEVQNYT